MTTTLLQTKSQKSPSLNRHARKCKICNHQDREDIELDFLHWQSCYAISADYNLDDTRAIYRHAHATGLYDRRLLNVKFAAAHIVDHAESCEPSANAVLKAIQALTHINDRGKWIETPRRIIYQVEHHHISVPPPPPQPALSDTQNPPSDESETEISNRHWMRLENAVTPTKQ
jgi:hypothetical protein